METLLVEEEVTPCQEDLGPCFYHYLSPGGVAGLCHLQVSEGQSLGF